MDQFESSDNATGSPQQNSNTNSYDSGSSYVQDSEELASLADYYPTECSIYRPLKIKPADFISTNEDSDDEPFIVSLGRRSTGSQNAYLYDVSITQMNDDTFKRKGGTLDIDKYSFDSPKYIPSFPPNESNYNSKEFKRRSSHQNAAIPVTSQNKNMQKPNLYRNQSQQNHVQVEKSLPRDSVKDLIQEQKRKLEEQRLKNVNQNTSKNSSNYSKQRLQQIPNKIQQFGKVQKKSGQLNTGLKTLERMNNTVTKQNAGTKNLQKPSHKQKPAGNINILEMLKERKQNDSRQISENSHSYNSQSNQSTSPQNRGIGGSFKRNDSITNTSGLDSAWKFRQNNSLPGLETAIEPENKSVQQNHELNQNSSIKYGRLSQIGDVGQHRQQNNQKQMNLLFQQRQQSQHQSEHKGQLSSPPKPNKQQNPNINTNKQQQYGKLHVLQSESPQAPKIRQEVQQKPVELSEFDQKVQALDSRLYTLSKSKIDIQAAGGLSLDLSVNHKRGLGQVARLLMRHSEAAMAPERRQGTFIKLICQKIAKDMSGCLLVKKCISLWQNRQMIDEAVIRDLSETFNKQQEDISKQNYGRYTFKGGILVDVIGHESFRIDNWPDILGWTLKTDYLNPQIVLTQDEDDTVIAQRQFEEVIELRKKRDQQLQQEQEKQRLQEQEKRVEVDRKRLHEEFQSGLTSNLKQKQGFILKRWQQKMQAQRQQEQLARQEAQKSQPQVQQRTFQFQSRAPDVQQQQQYQNIRPSIFLQSQSQNTQHPSSKNLYFNQQSGIQQPQLETNNSLRQDYNYNNIQFQSDGNNFDPELTANQRGFFLQRKRLSPEQHSRIINWLRESPSPKKKPRLNLPRGIQLAEAPFGQPPLPDKSPTTETPPFTPPNEEFKPPPMSPPPLPEEVSQLPAAPLVSEPSAYLKEDKYGKPHTPTEPPLPEGQPKPPSPFMDVPHSPPPEPQLEESGIVHTPPSSPPLPNNIKMQYTPEQNNSNSNQNMYKYGQIQERHSYQQFQDNLNLQQEDKIQFQNNSQYNSFEGSRLSDEYTLNQNFTPNIQQVNYLGQQQATAAQDYYQSQQQYYQNIPQQNSQYIQNENQFRQQDVNMRDSFQNGNTNNQYYYPQYNQGQYQAQSQSGQPSNGVQYYQQHEHNIKSQLSPQFRKTNSYNQIHHANGGVNKQQHQNYNQKHYNKYSK